MAIIGCQFGSVVDHVIAWPEKQRSRLKSDLLPFAACFPPLSPLSCQSTVSILYRQNAKENPGFVSVYELPLLQQEL